MANDSQPMKVTQLRVAYYVAQTQVGVSQVSGKKHNPMIVEYAQSCLLQAQDDETPWCSNLVNWSYIIAGLLLNKQKMLELLRSGKFEESDIVLFEKSAAALKPRIFLAAPQGEFPVKLPTRSAMARSWIGFAKATKTPKEGDVVIYERGNNGYSGHVGFLKKQNITSNTTLGGNQNNKVGFDEYARYRVLAYITED